MSARDLGPDHGHAAPSTAFHNMYGSDDGDVVTAASMQRLAKFALTDWVSACDLIKQGLDALPFPHGRQQAHVDPCWILAGWDNRPDLLRHTVAKITVGNS